MQQQDRFIGYLLLGEKISGQEYTEADLEFLTTLVNQAVTSLENARLFEETLEKQRMEEELNVARNIQKKLLPKAFPSIESYEIYGVNHSSKQVGGDYYDIISLDDQRIALAIGDVSGKGVPASLLMANLQAALRVLIKIDLPLNEVVSRLNHLIYENTTTDKFITFFVAILNIKTHELEYVNAGHNNPVLRKRSGELIFLDKGGLILGVLPEYTYELGQAKLQPGDLLLAYTDGVNEAVNEKGDEWGEEALYDLVRQHNQNEPIQKLIDRILVAIDKFAGNIPQADDVTMLGLKRR
jgi:sigma-B regulation protein RsbU (phosphoserine phosphatase)